MLKNITIKTKLALLTAIPFIFILYNSYVVINNSYIKSKNMQHLEYEVKKSIAINALVHELQKERGFSAGYVSSNGKIFKDELSNQREVTNTKIQNLENNFNILLFDLKQLNKVRLQIDHLEIDTKYIIDYYSNNNKIFLNKIMKISMSIDDKQASQYIISYSNLSFVKEMLGIQRALGNIIFSKGILESKDKLNFLKIEIKENLYLENHILYATAKEIKYIKDIKKNDIFQEVQKIKNDFKYKSISGKLKITPKHWNDLATKEINLYYEDIKYITNNLITYINQAKNNANQALLKVLIIDIIYLSFILLVTYLVQNSLMNAISKVKQNLKDIVNHNQKEENDDSVIVDFRDIVKYIKTILEYQKQAKESKDLFFANMSHDIRTPLNGIIGTLNILKKTNIDKEQDKYLNTCKNSSNMLLSIVNDILDLSKMETGKFTLDNQACEIKTELEMVGSIFEANMKDKGLEYISKIDDNLPEILICDINRLKQVFTNLLSNAVKFTKEGTITFEVKVISQNNEKAAVRFAIIDTGIGIAKDKQSLIFEAFAQEDQTTATKFGGTGLGTNIAKNIVELYNGQLEIKSEQGKGSEFYFTIELDIAKRRSDNDIEDDKLISSFPNAKILIAEDNATNQMVIEMLLEDFEIEDITIVDDGEKAVEEYKNNQSYDMILMDINMPIMGGIEATNKIINFQKNHKSEESENSVAIVALTANVMKEDIEKYREQGMVDTLAKPVEEEKLLQILNKYIKVT